jgi:hypothetical protein
MTAHRRPRRGGGGTARGFILIEVLVSVVLLGIVIVCLATATSSARERAGSTWGQAEIIGQRTTVEDGADPWEWGCVISEAEWAAGPSLELTVAPDVGESAVVGVWVEGWLVAERVPDTERQVHIRAAELAGSEGKELVVRVRAEGAGWGPPWRLLVPDGRTGSGSGLPAPLAMASGTPPPAGAISVVHLPRAGTQIPETSFLGTVTGAAEGLPTVLLPGVTAGSCGVTLDGRSQSWWMEDGRVLDVYF